MLNKILKIFLKVEADTTAAVDGLEDVKKQSEEAEKALKKIGDTGKESMEGLKDVTNSAKDTIDDLTGGAVSGFSKFKTGIGSVTKSMGTLKGAVAATGIGLLLVAFTTLISYFKNSEEGSRKLAIATEALGIIFNKIQTVLASLGEKLVSVFENPKESLATLGNLIKENISNRVEGLLELLPALGTAIKLAFSGEFAKAGEVAINAVAKVGLGVENITDKAADFGNSIKDGFNQLVDSANQAVASATALVDAQRGARNLQQALIVQNAQLTKELEGQKKIAEDTTLTYEERGKALDEVDKIQIKLARNLVAQASAEENLLRMQMANTASYEEREALETELAQKQAERIGLETQLQTVEQESGKLRRELLKERADGLQAIQDQIFAVEESSKEAFGRSELEKINIKKQADIELINLEEANLLKEAERLQASEEEKQAIRDAYSTQRLATEQVVADQIAKIEQGISDQIVGIEQATQSILNELNVNQFAILEAENQAKLDAIQAQKDAAIRAATEQGVETTQIAAAYDAQLLAQEEVNADRRKQLEEQVQQAKIQLASQGLGAIGSLFKEGSKVAKAFAVSQAVMDTYGAITATLKSAAANPASILFPAFPYIQAGIMAVNGFANVKKILATQPGSSSSVNASSGGGGGSVSSAPSAPRIPGLSNITNPTVNQIGASVAGQMSQQPVKAYVSQKDLNTSSEFDRLNSSAARL